MKDFLSNLAERIAGRTDRAQLQTELVGRIAAGELAGDLAILKAELTKHKIPDDEADSFAGEILKAALGALPAAIPPVAGAQTEASVETPPNTEFTARIEERLERIEKAISTLLTPGLQTIGNGIALLLDEERNVAADVTVLKSDVAKYLAQPVIGARPVEQATPPAPGAVVSADEVQIIRKGVAAGRFGSLETAAWVASGYREPTEAMRAFVAEHRGGR